MIRAEAYKVKVQIVIGRVKNVSCVTQVGVQRVDGRLSLVFEDDRSCNFCIIISGLNGMSPVFLKDSLIVFFLNACKQIVVIRTKNSSFENL